MRHFFASYLLKMGYTTKQIMAVGGWKTDNVLKTVYQHAMDLDQSKINIAEDIGKVIDLPTNLPTEIISHLDNKKKSSPEGLLSSTPQI